MDFECPGLVALDVEGLVALDMTVLVTLDVTGLVALDATVLTGLDATGLGGLDAAGLVGLGVAGLERFEATAGFAGLFEVVEADLPGLDANKLFPSTTFLAGFFCTDVVSLFHRLLLLGCIMLPPKQNVLSSALPSRSKVIYALFPSISLFSFIKSASVLLTAPLLPFAV